MVIYAIARRGVNPMVNAISALIVFGFGSLILISERLREKPARESAHLFDGRRWAGGVCTRCAAAAERLQLVGLHRAVDGFLILSESSACGCDTRLRKQRGDAGARVERQFRLDIVFPTDYIVKPMLANDLWLRSNANG